MSGVRDVLEIADALKSDRLGRLRIVAQFHIQREGSILPSALSKLKTNRC